MSGPNEALGEAGCVSVGGVGACKTGADRGLGHAWVRREVGQP